MASSRYGILIRTYDRDAERLSYCLRSIGRFCSGFDEVVVVCQKSSEAAIKPVVSQFPFASLKLCPAYSFDYIGQQITKLRAHTCVDSEFIFHVDSDCVFTKPFQPSDSFIEGMPVLYHREYDYFYRQKRRIPWQGVTSYFLLRQVDFEFMALFPLVYPRAIYQKLESWFEKEHGFSYEGIEQHLNARWEFSEFNLLGGFSYYYGREFGPFHCHLNWGQHPPEHYVRQLCQAGEDRAITLEEATELEKIIAA